MLPGTICSLKDITIVSDCILPPAISPPNRQGAKPLDPVSANRGKVIQNGRRLLDAGAQAIPRLLAIVSNLWLQDSCRKMYDL
jgi:hypothetical protein